MRRGRAATSCSATPWTAASPRPTTGWTSCSPSCSGRAEANEKKGRRMMNWTLEVVVVPVSDVDRAKAFYAQQLGFTVDHDTSLGGGNWVVQLTPPGSGCSVVVGSVVVPDMPPGSLKGLQLVVADIHKARAQLVERGVEVGEVQVMGENPDPEVDP